MAFSLPAVAIGAGTRLAVFDTIGSTSTEALARAASGERGPLWVVSPEQTAGRGRRGSPWQTIRGNLAASLLLTTSLEPAVIAQLGFVAGVALVAALERIGCGDAAFRLKWPNDVVTESGKLSGILLQTEAFHAGERSVVIGIGVNVVAAPRGLTYPTTSLRDMGSAAEAETVFSALSESWLSCERAWAEGRGFDGIRREWLSRAAGLGGPVSVRIGDGAWHGRFETIDETGQLVMRCDDGSSRTISAGDVYFGSAHTERGARPGGLGGQA
ncbi:biotin--[acetyl-CoA-carboxylase] ligase [Enterovirga rhinocerotis]|uniref:biotin--[biotin carboxyl-carrier protein] ligase n=1 Tax=Enterovirga rhinocerotis TaxID=1339210 RepID=A0A4R7CA43_9HYPH|nr:biotin--[acetyl-CoA-carboxylase] ligase [Enterovirga rhinocerotis]TDR94235.1 BirA family biotin operon repressor/biotin-[acetyl-CoA-carboxylase] ligase [Enterovirga rhinocerotis]